MNFDDYKVTTPYPEAPRQPEMPRYGDLHKWREELAAWEKELQEWGLEVNEWRRADSVLNRKFKEDVLREYGLEGHPKAEKIYEISWSEGHSAGLYGVKNWVEKLAELVKD